MFHYVLPMPCYYYNTEWVIIKFQHSPTTNIPIDVLPPIGLSRLSYKLGVLITYDFIFETSS